MENATETPAPEPIEQLAQQQQEEEGEEIPFESFRTELVSTVAGHRHYIRGLDDEGRLWERDDTMPPGKWYRIQGPRR
jgi:hypothetical protein